MRRLCLFAALLLAAPLAFAAKPTDAQVDRLMEVMHSRDMLEQIMAQSDQMQANMVKGMLGDRKLTDAEQKKLDRALVIINRTTHESLAWDRMGPLFRNIYAESFDGEDIDAMIAFYASPAGQHVLEKMPVLAQKTMATVQEVLIPSMEKMHAELEKEFADEPAAE